MNRDVLEQLDGVAEPDALLVVLAWLARPPIDEDVLHGAVRRAVLLVAAGGDPHRALELDGRAVTALAAELDSPERRAALAAGLASLQTEADGLPAVSEALVRLHRDPDLAWRAYAAALLSDELESD